MSDAENPPALPENEEKPVPIVKPEETVTPTGNGETDSVDNDNEVKEKIKPTVEAKEESENGAKKECKESPMPMEVDTEKKEPVIATEVTSTPEKAEASPTKKTDTDGDAKEEDSSSDEEPPLGLLERPVEVSGKRERKKTERLSMSGTFTPTDKKLDVPEGSGLKLGDIPRVEHFIAKTTSDDCKILHRTIYGRPGTVAMVKRNLRKFCGFTFSEDSAEFTKKKINLSKVSVVELKRVAGLLDQDKTGSREEVAERCIKFLLNPQDSGLPLPPKKTHTKGGAKKEGKRKRKSKKGDGDGDDIDDDDDDENDDDVSGDSNKAASDVDQEGEKSEAASNDDDGSDVEQPKKKKPRLESPKKKKPTKTATAKPKKEKKEKKEKKKKEKKKAASKKKKAANSDDESSDDDKPLAKKSKKGPPTNDEIRDLVKNILEGANLEEVTMKTVCKQVYLKFPDYDLTDKKDFIKSTVKQLIS